MQNVTDIDDPLLERAARDGEDWLVLAMRETALFREDMEALRIAAAGALRRRGRVDPGASSTRVAELLDRGVAYRLDDGTGDVYFDITAAPDVRLRVAPGPRPTMLTLSAERGGDPDRAGKRDPLDPLLWRGARDGEPAWDGGPLGPGRPGLAHRVRGDRAGPAGRPYSTCRAAATTCSTRTTSVRPRTPRCSPARRRSPGTTCTPA